MIDSLLDDVKTLLDKEKGDERILKQIYRACENNEVISNYERNYVQKLAEKHLGRSPQIEGKHTDTPLETSQKQNTDIFHTATPKITKSKSKNTKLLLGLGGTILTLIIIVGIFFTVVSHVDSDSLTSVDSTSLLIQTDLTTYQNGDIISISGKSHTTGKINISIENPKGQSVWSEQISVKDNGSFSTLTVAGGVGWEKSGTFTITAKNNSETKSQTFSFKL